MERRRGHRLKRRLACEVSYKGACERGCVVDLSHDGFFVALSDAGIPDPGSEVEIRLEASDDLPALAVSGTVACLGLLSRLFGGAAARGFGLRILRAPDAYHCALDAASLAGATDSGESSPEIEGAEPSHDPTQALLTHPLKGGAEAGAGTEDSDLSSAAILVDDGELDDVYELLQELGANPLRISVTGPDRFVNWVEPPRVFVAAARTALSVASAEDSQQAPADRRKNPRGQLRQEVVALDGQAERVMLVLVGRDLSRDGLGSSPIP